MAVGAQAECCGGGIGCTSDLAAALTDSLPRCQQAGALLVAQRIALWKTCQMLLAAIEERDPLCPLVDLRLERTCARFSYESCSLFLFLV